MRIAILFTFLCVLAGGAQAQGTGLGIILGEPTGISFKNWTGSASAIDAAIAWSFDDEDSIHLHADFLRHDFGLIDVDPGSMPFYYGVGARLKLEDDPRLGVRGPLGLAYHFQDAPFDIFLEVVPMLDLIPDTEFEVDAALGARYFWGKRTSSSAR